MSYGLEVYDGEAAEFGLPVIDVDGSATPEDTAADLADRFRLT